MSWTAYLSENNPTVQVSFTEEGTQVNAYLNEQARAPLQKPLILTEPPTSATVTVTMTIGGTDYDLIESGESGNRISYSSDGGSSPPESGEWLDLAYNGTRWIERFYVDGVLEGSEEAAAGTERNPWQAVWGGDVESIDYAETGGTSGTLDSHAIVNGLEAWNMVSEDPIRWVRIDGSGGGGASISNYSQIESLTGYPTYFPADPSTFMPLTSGQGSTVTLSSGLIAYLATQGTPYSSPGHFFMPDLRMIRWIRPNGVNPSGSIYYWFDHDNQGGEFIAESVWRFALICPGPVQLGDNGTRERSFCLELVSGQATSDSPIRHSPAVIYQTCTYYSGGYHEKFFATQAVPLTSAGTDVVWRGFKDATIANFAINSSDIGSGLVSGTMVFEFSETGLWTPGTAPDFTALTDGATITQTCDKHKAVQNAKVTLGGNRTLAIASSENGMRGVILVTQDGTGGRTLTLPVGSVTTAGFALSADPGAVDKIEWVKTGDVFVFSSSKDTAVQPGDLASASVNYASSAGETGLLNSGTIDGPVLINSTSVSWGAGAQAAFKTALSLNNVENTAFSTWAGTTNITTAGALTVTSLTTTGTVQAARFNIAGNVSAAAWTTNGLRFYGTPGTLTDTTSSGTVAAAYTNKLGGNTIAASNSTTFTTYCSLYVSDPVAGSNVTLTNKYAIGCDSLLVAGAFYLATGTTVTLSGTVQSAFLTALGGTTTGIALLQASSVGGANAALGAVEKSAAGLSDTSGTNSYSDVTGMSVSLPAGNYICDVIAQFTNAGSSSCLLSVLFGSGVSFASTADRVGNGIANGGVFLVIASSSTKAAELGTSGHTGTATNNVTSASFGVVISSDTTAKLQFKNPAGTGTVTMKNAFMRFKKLP